MTPSSSSAELWIIIVRCRDRLDVSLTFNRLPNSRTMASSSALLPQPVAQDHTFGSLGVSNATTKNLRWIHWPGIFSFNENSVCEQLEDSFIDVRNWIQGFLIISISNYLSALQWSHLTQISLSGTWCVFFRTFFFDAVSNWRQYVWWQYCGLEDIWRMWSPTCILQVPAPTVQFWWRGNSAAAVILYPARSLPTKYCLVWWTTWWQFEHAARIFSFSGEKAF